MIIPSGSKHEEPGAVDTPPVVPLADLPLVADHQQTVVTSRGDSTDSSVTAADSVDVHYADPALVLFSADGSDTVPGPVRLEHFEVRRRIGSGGMGKVFLAEDMTLRRPVALKVLNPGSAAEPALLARFQNEARSAALLRHDNIAQVYYTGASQGVHFIACEYIAGRTIRDLIEEHEILPTDLVLNYAVQATLALNHMYAAGVVHRDIKPSNIIVSNEGRVKIVDLGLARRDSPDSICDITVAGSTLGTFDYLAPEQARDPREADVRSDTYSLGCTLYHMLTGQPPYPEGTALQKLLDHQGKQAPDPAHINNQVPDDIADIILTMMNTDPADRYQTPGELLSELIEVATDMGLQGVPADGVIWQQDGEPGIREHSGTLVLLALVLVFCVTAVTLHLSNTGPATDMGTGQFSTLTEEEISRTPDIAAIEDSKGPETEETETSVPIPGVSGAFLVHSPNARPQGYKTLTEALEDPQERIEIELTFDGLSPIPLKRLPRLERQTVHLYAADGVHPVLEFRGIRNVADATSLFTLINSNMTLEGIAIRLVPEGDAIDAVWSVFDCSGSTYLDLRQCSIDIVNADGATVDICRLKESTSDKDSSNRNDVQLTDVVVRGEADMFHVETRADGQIRLNNCGLGLNGHLVNNTGSSMNGPGSLEVILEHVTCVLGSPLIRIFENEFLTARRTTSEVLVTSRASVFCSTVDSGTLIMSQGNGLLDELRELLNWNGDTNLYSGYELFWRLQIPNEPDLADLAYTLDEWKSHWNKRSESRENNAFLFDWQDAAWKSGPDDPDESSTLDRLQPDWLRIDGTQFAVTQKLPYHLNREVPGVVFRRLPKFQQLPDRAFDDEVDPAPPVTQ